MIPTAPISQAKFTDVSSDTVVDVVVVICAILGAVFLVVSLVEKFRAKKTSTTISPDPLQVQEVKELATKAELISMEQRLTAKISAVEGDIDKEQRVAREEQGNLHRRIDELVETMAETKGLLSGVKENTDRLLARSLK
jgi:Icc-related predicted phosphoesterase